MKKIVCLLLLVSIVAIAVSCGGSGSVSSSSRRWTTATTEDDGKVHLKIGETASTITWKNSDGMYIVITHDGTNVTKYELYAECKDAEEASAMAESLAGLLAETENSAVKKIYSKDVYVIYEYAEGRFPISTYSDAKRTYDLLKKIK